MGEGFQRKIDTIVYSIIESEKINNRINEADISESIKKAISDLNDVGKMLVLDDLFNDAGKTPSKLLTLDGKLSIESLNQVVNAKIEEAARGGIDLRKDAPIIFKDTKLLAVDAAITIATINVMVNSFKDLSYNQKKEIFDNWNLLTSHQKSSVLKSQSESLLEQALKEQNPKKKSLFKKASSATNSISQRIEEESQLTDEQVDLELEILLRQNPNFKLIYDKLSNKGMPTRKIYQYLLEKKGQEIFKNGIDIENKEIDGKKMLTLNQYFDQENNKQKEAKFLRDPNFHKYLGLTREEAFELSQEEILVKGSTYLFRTSPEILKYYGITPEEAELISDEKCKDMFDQYNAYLLKINENGKSENLEDKIKQEIEQLPVALGKANFSQEEIKEALIEYHTYISEFTTYDEEVLAEIKNMDSKKIVETFRSSFLDLQNEGKISSNTLKILNILSENDFGGQLQQILTNPQLLQETFLPALSAEIEKLEQQPIPDEHTDEYYRSQATTLTLDRNVEEIAKKVQAQGGSVKEITVALAKKIEERATEQSQHSIPEEESKEQKTEQPTPPIFENPTTPEEPTPESATSPEQENLEETGQNMAMVKQDNSFIGKIRRVFANMKDMKNKDNSKGFFARLGASIKTVFGNKEERYEAQDSTSTVPTPENQSQSTARREPINYITQHFEVNESIARKETEKSKKAKDFSNADDRTTDEEEK